MSLEIVFMAYAQLNLKQLLDKLRILLTENKISDKAKKIYYF